MYGIPTIRPTAPAGPTLLFSFVRFPSIQPSFEGAKFARRLLAAYVHCHWPASPPSPPAVRPAGFIGARDRYLRAGPTKTISSYDKHEKPAHVSTSCWSSWDVQFVLANTLVL